MYVRGNDFRLDRWALRRPSGFRTNCPIFGEKSDEARRREVEKLVRALLSDGPVLALLAFVAQLPEEIDLIDRIDEVDPSTRTLIEEGIDRGGDLMELGAELDDIAFAPLSRDGAISLFALFSHWLGEREVTAFLLVLTIAFDELIAEPEGYGTPPDEHRRFELCLALQRAPPGDRIGRAARNARYATLECGP